MARPAKVTKEEIVSAGLAVVDAEGLTALSARRVARQLGVSTAPVYVCFSSMDALTEAVMQEAVALLLAYTRRLHTDRPFLNIGTGTVLYSKEHPTLYRALFLEGDRFEKLVRRFLAEITRDMANDGRFTHLPNVVRAQLLARMWTYTHGMASLIAVGITRRMSKDAIVRSLIEVGTPLIREVLTANPAR